MLGSGLSNQGIQAMVERSPLNAVDENYLYTCACEFICASQTILFVLHKIS